MSPGGPEGHLLRDGVLGAAKDRVPWEAPMRGRRAAQGPGCKQHQVARGNCGQLPPACRLAQGQELAHGVPSEGLSGPLWGHRRWALPLQMCTGERMAWVSTKASVKA